MLTRPTFQSWAKSITRHEVNSGPLSDRTLQTPRLAHVQPAEPLLPAVEHRRADPVFTAHPPFSPGLALLQYPDDLLFAEVVLFFGDVNRFAEMIEIRDIVGNEKSRRQSRGALLRIKASDAAVPLS